MSAPEGATDWREVWRRKGSVEVDDYSLETLLRLDGYETGAARCSPEEFREFSAVVERELSLRPGDRLLEVGCGAGALLSCLRESGLQLFGIDYSRPLVDHARKAIPEASFAVAEATELPFEADAVVCCGVFQYFPDLDYAARVIAEFERVAPAALILHVPDLALRDDAEQERRSGGSQMAEHRYYPRSFFAGAQLLPDEAPGYPLARYYFDALYDFRKTTT